MNFFDNLKSDSNLILLLLEHASLKEIREPSLLTIMKKLTFQIINKVEGINVNMEKMSQELARIHAHLCGDGSVFIFRTKEKDRNWAGGIGYYNNNQRLLDKFRADFSTLFGVRMKMRKNREVSIRSVKRAKEFMEKFGSFGSREWRIHSSIKNSTKKVRLEWLKAFFEDEAYHEKRYNRLKIKSVNSNGLKDIKDLLDSVGIFSSLTGPNSDESYYLTITRFDTIQEFFGFIKEPIRKKE